MVHIHIPIIKFIGCYYYFLYDILMLEIFHMNLFNTKISLLFLAVISTGFITRGITFRNTAGPQNHQAVAMQ